MSDVLAAGPPLFVTGQSGNNSTCHWSGIGVGSGRSASDAARGLSGLRAILFVFIGVASLAGTANARADEPSVAAESTSTDASGTATAVTDAVSPAGQAATLIRAMSAALRTLDYEGTFVHLSGDDLTSLAIIHTSDGSGERERLSALDGEAREVFRNDTLVTCIWPESRSVLVTESKERGSLPAIDASLADNAYYVLALRDDDRVAGLDAHVVEVMPRDALRYGYRFWIDRQTHMLLRSMLLDERRQPLEQLLFTSIHYPESIAPERFDIAGVGVRRSWLRAELKRATGNAAASIVDAPTAPDTLDRVAFETLPDGYREVAETRAPMPEHSRPVSHVMLSDGMAAVSVYVEHVPEPEQQGGALGLSRMGAMNAYGVSLVNAFVTAVGEVPAETVERIARATRVIAR